MLLKKTLYLAWTILILGCAPDDPSAPDTYVFITVPDTLRLHLQKVKGTGIFGFGYSELRFFDTTDLAFPHLAFSPNITEVKFARELTDAKPSFLKSYQEAKIDSIFYTNFLSMPELIAQGKIDTANLLPAADYFIYMLQGKKDGENILVVDENGNKDFTDDPIRVAGPLKPKSLDNLIKCEYPVYNDHEFVLDSCWIKVGFSEVFGLSIGEAFHHIVDFSIAGSEYKLGVLLNDAGGMTFAGKAVLALLDTGEMRDYEYLPTEKRIAWKEYVQLGENYYQFYDITNDGRWLTLVKEENFGKQVGIQKGMIAPAFACKTIDGMLINSKKIGNEPLLITNLTACGEGTLKEYNAILEASLGTFNVLAMEPDPKGDREGFIVNTEDDFNRAFHETYRKDYSSRICYLIDENNRILEKFTIKDWEKYLAKYLFPDKAKLKD